MVREVRCTGSPYEIGQAHGSQAKDLIQGSIAFYAGLFQQTAAMDWPSVRETALKFDPYIRTKWAFLLEEMQGIADGAHVDLADILALNVRTEITFGMFSDGCTSLAWKTPETLFLSQNWDWMEEQKPNIILLHIEQKGFPTINTLLEAGLIGKIGLNSSGVGVCCNAIRAKGMDPERLPMHLALRVALNSTSLDGAVASLTKYGVASSCHILLADDTNAIGMEWSHLGHKAIPLMDNRIHHANHLLLDQPGITDTQWLPDSLTRIKRLGELTSNLLEPTVSSIQELFRDEKNLPGAICRVQEGDSTAATLFNIVMDLKVAKAHVLMGRPTHPEESFILTFGSDENQATK